jgi:hypothetical protein
MAIDPFLTGQAFDLTGQAFDQKAIREMSLALESVCNALGVRADDEPKSRLMLRRLSN